MAIIASAQNPTIKHLSKLSENARYRRDSGECVLDGIHLLDACLKAGQQPSKVYLAASQTENPEISALLAQLTSPVTLVADAVLAKASELKTPTGILAIYQPPKLNNAQYQRIVWLDDVQDPGNVGSILRSSAAAGVDAVYLSAACADAWSPRVLRAGMGAHFLMALYPQSDLLVLSRQNEGDLVVTSLEQSQSVYEAHYQLPVVWVFGNEGEGVRQEIQQQASCRIRIPMPGAMESLNVAAAAAVCLFEDVRRRTAGTLAGLGGS